MSSPKRFVDFAPRARRDYLDILAYTTQAWGERQSDRYAEKLLEGLDSLAAFPYLGKRRDEIAQGVRSLPIEHHVVYYRIVVETIRVLRIKHQRADVLVAGDI